MNKQFFCILGGPGSGKSTLCASLIQHNNVGYFSTGETLREYCRNNNDDLAKIIKESLDSGTFVDPSITIQFLQKFIAESDKKIIIIDGFPRNIDSYMLLPNYIKDNLRIIYLEADKNILLNRIKQRISEKRSDDNDAVIKTRLDLYYNCTMPLIHLLNDKTDKIVTDTLTPAVVLHQVTLLIKKPMFIQYLSDIHLEFYNESHVDTSYFFIPKQNAKNDTYLVLAGDIGYPSHQNYKNFIADSSKFYNKVFIISGNHEYYDNMNMDIVDALINSICSQFNNVYYLNNNEHLISENIVILGTTLWSKILPHEQPYIETCMNDYKHIKINDKVITTKYVNNLFLQNYTWLKNKVQEHQDKQIIIITHHSPSFRSIPQKYAKYEGNSAFSNNLDKFIMDNPHIKYWIFGHTHTSSTINIKGCLCYANPAGYLEDNGFENERFKLCSIINLS